MCTLADLQLFAIISAILLSNARLCWSNQHQQQAMTNLKFPAANLWIWIFRFCKVQRFPRQKVWTVTPYIMGPSWIVRCFWCNLHWWTFKFLGRFFSSMFLWRDFLESPGFLLNSVCFTILLDSLLGLFHQNCFENKWRLQYFCSNFFFRKIEVGTLLGMER